MYELTEILFRLFAWVRPLLWYYHRIGHVLEAALISLERPSVIQRLLDDPARRKQWAAITLDLEYGLDLAIAMRTRELLGQRIAPEPRPGLRHRHLIRIYRAPGFEDLIQRLFRLIARYNDIERLARLRAARLRRAAEAAPVTFAADHRPATTTIFALPIPTIPPTTISATPIPPTTIFSPGAGIRGPPQSTPIADCPLPDCLAHAPAPAPAPARPRNYAPKQRTQPLVHETNIPLVQTRPKLTHEIRDKAHP